MILKRIPLAETIENSAALRELGKIGLKRNVQKNLPEDFGKYNKQTE